MIKYIHRSNKIITYHQHICVFRQKYKVNTRRTVMVMTQFYCISEMVETTVKTEEPRFYPKVRHILRSP